MTREEINNKMQKGKVYKIIPKSFEFMNVCGTLVDINYNIDSLTLINDNALYYDEVDVIVVDFDMIEDVLELSKTQVEPLDDERILKSKIRSYVTFNNTLTYATTCGVRKETIKLRDGSSLRVSFIGFNYDNKQLRVKVYNVDKSTSIRDISIYDVQIIYF